jgi:hypothetical protein
VVIALPRSAKPCGDRLRASECYRRF